MAWSTSSKAYLSGLWVAVVIFLYLTLLTDDNVKPQPSASMSLHASGSRGKLAGLSSNKVIDAVVYIAMGSAAKGRLVEYSVASLRDVGEWGGKVFLLTDQTSCFDDLVSERDVSLVQVPQVSSVMEIKNIKANIYKHIPETVKSVLYIDVDIVVARSIRPFLNEVGAQVDDAQEEVDMAAFLDAKGHFVGWCDGCEKWHTGILLMFREKGGKCLETWGTTILSSRYDTDQESLDEAEASGACSNILPFASSNLLFAKDYLAMAFTSGSVFWHVTAGARLQEQDSFYAKMVVPYLRHNLRDQIDPSILDKPKTCA